MSLAWALACWLGELSQHPTCPHAAQRRRCSHQPGVGSARHSRSRCRWAARWGRCRSWGWSFLDGSGSETPDLKSRDPLRPTHARVPREPSGRLRARRPSVGQGGRSRWAGRARGWRAAARSARPLRRTGRGRPPGALRQAGRRPAGQRRVHRAAGPRARADPAPRSPARRCARRRARPHGRSGCC
jgi:hypothetical protein